MSSLLFAAASGWPALVLVLLLLGLVASLISLGCGPAPPPNWSNLRDDRPADDPAADPKVDPKADP